MTELEWDAVILAGGRGTRFGGRIKALLPRRPGESVSLLEANAHVLREVTGRWPILSTNQEALRQAAARLLPELQRRCHEPEPCGPLGALMPVFELCEGDGLLLVAGDMPAVGAQHWQALIAASQGQSSVIVCFDGVDQSFPSLVIREDFAALRAVFEAGQRSLARAFRRACRPLVLSSEAWREHDPEGRAFCNVNTDKDLRAWYGVEPE